MPNIFDYLKWRDLKIEKVEFTEVDNLILARLAYFPLDNAVEDKEITVKEAYEKYLTVKQKGRILQEEDSQLFPLLANSIRFGELKLTDYINKIDLNNEEQFSAVTILMPNDTIYVSFRGTDNTIVGWKEDLNMSFKELVPAQTTAKKYLNKIAKKYKDKQIIVGGHSKGGNLAVYAAAYCENQIQDRISKVYNNDGPGFCDKVINSEEYNKILNKVHTYLPKSSIIGRLLNHKEETTILESTETGIMQHDLYTWQLIGGSFIKAELTNSSEFIDKTITDLLLNVSVEQRSLCIDVLFEVLNATKAKTLSEINENKFSNIMTMIRTYKNLDEENKEIVTKVLNVLLKIGRSNIGKKE
ncbi:MAG: DUF2974 domain-containing protein [Clostridia bacterium]|nr:DUF2974 domain-containing protein [Clostridia bacterium]